LTYLLRLFRLGPGTQRLRGTHYYVASMACFSVITACFNNIAMAVTFQREDGIIKRAHATPLPGAAFLGAAFSWTDVLVVAAWGAAGVVLAIRFFSWEPRQGGSRAEPLPSSGPWSRFERVVGRWAGPDDLADDDLTEDEHKRTVLRA
jgi:hypothetical protein